MDWDGIKYVHAIAAKGTLSAAARHLRVSVATVHRRLGRFEATLGVRLFNRDRFGLTATPAGEAIAALAKEFDESVAELELKLAGTDLKPSGVVRLTTTDTLISVVERYLAEFRETHPEIVLELVISSAFLNLSRRDADIAIRPTTSPPETLVGFRLGKVTYSVYAAKSLLRRVEDWQSSELPWIGYDDSLAHLTASKWLAETHPDMAVSMRVNSLMSMAAAARQGVGLAVLPDFLAADGSMLVKLQDLPRSTGTDIWMLTHPELRHVSRIHCVIDYFGPRVREYLRGMD